MVYLCLLSIAALRVEVPEPPHLGEGGSLASSIPHCMLESSCMQHEDLQELQVEIINVSVYTLSMTFFAVRLRSCKCKPKQEPHNFSPLVCSIALDFSVSSDWSGESGVLPNPLWDAQHGIVVQITCSTSNVAQSRLMLHCLRQYLMKSIVTVHPGMTFCHPIEEGFSSLLGNCCRSVYLKTNEGPIWPRGSWSCLKSCKAPWSFFECYQGFLGNAPAFTILLVCNSWEFVRKIWQGFFLFLFAPWRT